MNLKVLQEVYKTVEAWQPRRLIKDNFHDSKGDVCALGTHPAWSFEMVNLVGSLFKKRIIKEFGYLGEFDDVETTSSAIHIANDAFVGTPEARWDYMTKWLLNQIQKQREIENKQLKVENIEIENIEIENKVNAY